MKLVRNILPKGAIAIKCPSDSKNFQNILTLSSATVLVIPSNNSNASNLNTLKALPSSTSSPNNDDHPLCLTYDSQDAVHNESTTQNYNVTKSSPLANREGKSSGSKANSKNRTQFKTLATGSTKLKGATNPEKALSCDETTRVTPSVTTFRNEQHEGNFPESIPQSVELYPKSDGLHETKDNSISFKEKVQYVNRGEKFSDRSKQFYSESGCKDFYTSSNGECISKPPDINLTNLGVRIPPSYETHVCNSALKVRAEGEGRIEISPNDFNSEIISLPLPYNQSPQEHDISLYMSPEAGSYTLPSDKVESSSNLTPFYAPDHVHYNNPSDNPVHHLSSGESSSASNINYLYEPSLTVREYESDARHSSTALLNCNTNVAKDGRLSGSNFDSNHWFLSNCDEEEEQPRDYSSNSGSNLSMNKRVPGNVDYVESFAENAKRQNFKENESSYEERRKLAIILLNTPESERKKALKENFWIVEDEPLEESIFSKREEEASHDFSNDSELLTVKPKSPKEYICHICGKMLRGRSSLRTHIFLHLNYKAYECPYCLRKFTQGSILRNHLRTHTGETPYSCCLCGKSFKTLSIMRKHLIKHSKLREFECCICSKRLKSKIILQNHLKIHLTGPHVCRICKTLFDSRRSLSTHVQKKHKSGKKFFCNLCNKGYGSSCLLKQHMNVHSNEQKHACHVCGASYVWKSGLAAHLRTHSFKIQCEMCGDKFISLKKLEKHRNRHSEPFPHKCSKCERQFKFSNLLKKHLAKHKDELSCRECGVGFMTKTKLRKHLKIHNSIQGEPSCENAL